MIADASSQTPAGVAPPQTNPGPMTIHEASRTLLKSPPELWTECSDATSLSRHLDSFGEIRITQLEPETAVAWEGDQVSGTVKLEPSGWGTRVILTAEEIDPVIDAEPEAIAEPEPVTQPEPEAVAEPEPAAEPQLPPEISPARRRPEPEPELKPSFFARLFGGKRKLSWPQVEPLATADEPEVDPLATAEEPTGVVDQEPVVSVEPERVAEPEPVVEPEPQAGVPEPELAPETSHPEQASEPTEAGPDATIRALTDALESLGMAHHRPFSRS